MLYRLTSRSASAKLAPGMYHDGGGLYLKVAEGGSKSFVFRFNEVDPIEGKSKRKHMGLGSAKEVSLAQARDIAERLRVEKKAGKSIFAERELDADKAKAKALALDGRVTFEEAAEGYIATHKASWKNKVHAAQWSSTLKAYAYPSIGAMPVDEIEVKHVVDLLLPIWLRVPETARRVRSRIETVLSRCKALGQRSGENPAAFKDNLEHLLPSHKRRKKGHHTALPWPQVPSVMRELEKINRTSHLALRFTILTAVRTSETLEAQWSEIDMEKALWTISAERMKMDRDHRVPLSYEALEVLEVAAKRRNRGKYVFGTSHKRKTLSNMAMLNVMRRLGSSATVHGFRSSFRDWCADATEYPREICEAALAHSTGNEVELAYKRTDLLARRRKLMKDWGAFCASDAPPFVGDVEKPVRKPPNKLKATKAIKTGGVK